MLGHTYRFQAYNASGVAVDVTVTGRRHRFLSDGSREDASASTECSLSALANSTAGSGATRDNSSDKYLGGHFTVAVVAGGSPSGYVALYLQHSTDGGTTWPDSQSGVLVARIPFTSAGTKRRNFQL